MLKLGGSKKLCFTDFMLEFSWKINHHKALTVNDQLSFLKHITGSGLS